MNYRVELRVLGEIGTEREEREKDRERERERERERGEKEIEKGLKGFFL